VVTVRSPIAAVARSLLRLYADFALASPTAFSDFHLHVAPPATLRRWIRPQVFFHFDQTIPFKPLPRSQAYPLFEWGFNYAISTTAHRYLIIHAAVVERGGRGLILPGPPGSGKSTLCATLIHSGWRLLSDELALIDLTSGLLAPIPRPVSLKNDSIELIRQRFADAVLSDPCHDTQKGTVAHLKPPTASVELAHRMVEPAWVVMPRYRSGSRSRLRPVPKGEMLMQLAEQSFNYTILGARGFEVLADLVERCSSHRLIYSDLDIALDRLNQLTGMTP